MIQGFVITSKNFSLFPPIKMLTTDISFRDAVECARGKDFEGDNLNATEAAVSAPASMGE